MKTPSPIAAVLICCVFGHCASADEIEAERVFRDVTIRRFDGEVVVFVPAGGESKARRLAHIRRMMVDSVVGLAPFNRGEQLFAEGDYTGAMESYNSSLTRARDFWKPLILARYLTACSRAGQLEEASRVYIQLVQMLPEKGHAFVPERFATAPIEQRRLALAVIDGAIKDVAHQEARWQVQMFQLALLHSVGDPRSAALTEEIIARLRGAGSSETRWRLHMTAIRLQVESGMVTAALGHIDDALPDVPRTHLDELLFLKGRCMYDTAEDRRGKLLAGLAFMRCAVHFDDGPFAARALLWAGQVHEDIGRIDESITLYNECLKMRQAEDRIIQEATARLERLAEQ